jgi:hypothetical protein
MENFLVMVYAFFDGRNAYHRALASLLAIPIAILGRKTLGTAQLSSDPPRFGQIFLHHSFQRFYNGVVNSMCASLNSMVAV